MFNFHQQFHGKTPATPATCFGHGSWQGLKNLINHWVAGTSALHKPIRDLLEEWSHWWFKKLRLICWVTQNPPNKEMNSKGWYFYHPDKNASLLGLATNSQQNQKKERNEEYMTKMILEKSHIFLPMLMSSQRLKNNQQRGTCLFEQFQSNPWAPQRSARFCMKLESSCTLSSGAPQKEDCPRWKSSWLNPQICCSFLWFSASNLLKG